MGKCNEALMTELLPTHPLYEGNNGVNSCGISYQWNLEKIDPVKLAK